MKKWLRRVRGAIGMGLTWAMAWFAAGMILLVIVGLGAADVPFPLFFALLGFLAGVMFSAILGIVERGRSFDQMSLPRFAAWGAAGGLLLSGIMSAFIGGGAFLVLGPVFALSGAACASGSLALARMATRREGLHAAANVEAAGLTEEEARDLLGGGG